MSAVVKMTLNRICHLSEQFPDGFMGSTSHKSSWHDMKHKGLATMWLISLLWHVLWFPVKHTQDRIEAAVFIPPTISSPPKKTCQSGCFRKVLMYCLKYVEPLFLSSVDTLALYDDDNYNFLLRFYKLHERKCEPIIMTVPRKVSLSISSNNTLFCVYFLDFAPSEFLPRPPLCVAFP